MRNFESPSAPAEAGPAGVRAVIEAVTDHFSAFRRRYALSFTFYAAVIGTTNVQRHAEEAAQEKDRQEQANEQAKLDAWRESMGDADIRFNELRALDHEATPERMRVLLSTLPRGFVGGEVASIGFRDEKDEMSKAYGPELQLSSGSEASASGGKKEAESVITYWRGAKGQDSRELWGETLEHELGHANSGGSLCAGRRHPFNFDG